MDRQDIRDRLIAILKRPDFCGAGSDLSAIEQDASLLETIISDSLQLLDFIVAIEHEFKLRFTNDHLRLDVFDRFERLVELIESGLAEKDVTDRGEQRADSTA